MKGQYIFQVPGDQIGWYYANAADCFEWCYALERVFSGRYMHPIYVGYEAEDENFAQEVWFMCFEPFGINKKWQPIDSEDRIAINFYNSFRNFRPSDYLLQIHQGTSEHHIGDINKMLALIKQFKDPALAWVLINQTDLSVVRYDPACSDKPFSVQTETGSPDRLLDMASRHFKPYQISLTEILADLEDLIKTHVVPITTIDMAHNLTPKSPEHELIKVQEKINIDRERSMTREAFDRETESPLTRLIKTGEWSDL